MKDMASCRAPRGPHDEEVNDHIWGIIQIKRLLLLTRRLLVTVEGYIKYFQKQQCVLPIVKKR